MLGFLVAYAVIAGVVSKNVASWSVGQGLSDTWFAAFKAVFVLCLSLLCLGHVLVW